MGNWFVSGRIVDLILLLMLAEGVLLWIWHRRTASGVAPADLLVNLASGMSLLLALRAALLGLSWSWIAVALTAALFCHLADLRRRWVGRVG
ncbi:MAG: hypothetical protein NVS9B10_02580 [Nevskia sp.]